MSSAPDGAGDERDTGTVLRADIRVVARELVSAFGPTIIAAATGTKDLDLPLEWTQSDGRLPKDDADRRLRFMLHQWYLVESSEGREVARLWFLGGNSELGEDTPLTAIREDRFDEVITAVATVTTPGVLG